jgi:subtilisin-like proprotein convertase family protein
MTFSRLMACLAAGVLATSLAVAQLSGSYYASANAPIPSVGTGGSAGGCGSSSPNVTELTVNVPATFVVSRVRVELTLTHTYVGDLTLTLKHCGTSVELYDRTPASSSNLSGTYAFDDQATALFANFVTTSPVVPPGDYLPVNPLSPFHGKSSAGAWTISICDQAGGDVGVLSSMLLQLFGDQSYGGPISPPESIPDGNGDCLAPVVRAINVPTGGIVDKVSVTLGLNHPDINQLTISLAHDGVVVTLTQAGWMISNVGVQGLYTFFDFPGIMTPFSSMVNLTPPGSNVPNGGYAPWTPLSAFAGHSKSGVWLLTICDSWLSDVGTISHAQIRLSESAWDLTVSQPAGPSSLVFTNEGGSPGNTYLNLATVVPGSFPNGWLNGLDISMTDIMIEISLGPPIIGTLESCGTAFNILNGPFPPGLAIQFVSFELDSSGTPVASEHAFQYVTL